MFISTVNLHNVNQYMEPRIIVGIYNSELLPKKKNKQFVHTILFMTGC